MKIADQLNVQYVIYPLQVNRTAHQYTLLANHQQGAFPLMMGELPVLHCPPYYLGRCVFVVGISNVLHLYMLTMFVNCYCVSLPHVCGTGLWPPPHHQTHRPACAACLRPTAARWAPPPEWSDTCPDWPPCPPPSTCWASLAVCCSPPPFLQPNPAQQYTALQLTAHQNII